MDEVGMLPGGNCEIFPGMGGGMTGETCSGSIIGKMAPGAGIGATTAPQSVLNGIFPIVMGTETSRFKEP